MPLSVFDHSKFAYFTDAPNASGSFKHSFGGQISDFGFRYANIDPDALLHLIYCLDLTDPVLPVDLPNVTQLPLLYGFRCMVADTTFIYRVLPNSEIEFIEPTEFLYDMDIPYPGHPQHFPRHPVSFQREQHDRAIAEDALKLQGIFGLDGLAAAEMARAIEIAFSQKRYDGSVYEYGHVERPEGPVFVDWTDEQILRTFGESPFLQSSPYKTCDNPDCTADVVGHAEAMEIDLGNIESDPPMAKIAEAMGVDPAEITTEYFGTDKLKVEARDERADTMRVFAIHQPDPDDTLVWGDHYNQIVFEICDACHCIRASHQCA